MSTIAKKLLTIAENQQRVYDAGYAKGQAEGGDSYYDEFWDAYQDYGKRTNYTSAFAGLGWKDAFHPKYDIVPTVGYMIFRSFYLYDSQTMSFGSLKKALEEQGVTLDFSKCTNMDSAFHWMQTCDIGVVDLNSCTNSNLMFAYSMLSTIDELVLSEKTQIASNMFTGVERLTHLIVSGVIASNGFDIHWSTKLDKESITSIINCLSTTTSGLAVTVSQTAVNKAFETAEGANDGSTSAEWLALIATKPNWTINLS